MFESFSIKYESGSGQSKLASENGRAVEALGPEDQVFCLESPFAGSENTLPHSLSPTFLTRKTETVGPSAYPTSLRQESKQVMEIAQVSLNKKSDTQTVVYPHNRILLINKGNKLLIQATNPDDSQKHYTKGKETQRLR